MVYKIAAILLNSFLNGKNTSISKKQLEKFLESLPDTGEYSGGVAPVRKLPEKKEDYDIFVGSNVIYVLHSLNVSPNLKGYYYLYIAILMVLQADGHGIKITKHIYPHIAMQQETSPSAVERAMRNAINKAANSQNNELFKKLGFNYKKITNGQFISGVTDYIRTSNIN